MNPLAWFRRSRLVEIDDEIRAHLEEKIDALVARGMSRADAVAEARRSFGNVTATQETARDVWRLEVALDSLVTDVRHVLRGLMQKPGFAIAVILTLALGIGANAAVFALVNAVVLKPLPYPDPNRIISLSQANAERRDGGRLNVLPLTDWSQTTRSTETWAAYDAGVQVIKTQQGPERINGLGTTPSYFGIFGVRPLIGRTYDERETLPGDAQVVVLSEPLWRGGFGGDSAIVGKNITVGGKPCRVIGVLPARFTEGRPERYWIPMRVATPDRNPHAESGEWVGYSVVARLRPDASIETVRAELQTVFDRLKPQGVAPNGGTAVVMTLHERRHGDTRRPLLLLFGAVGVLLLTACANITNLALARAARREREFALRLALGASRSRIVRCVLIENLALALGGALVGLLLVRASLGWFVHVGPEAIQNTAAIGVSGTLVVYASVVAMLTALLFGLVPAMTASWTAPNQMLSSGTAPSAGSPRHSFARRALVVGELAIALVFLTGAGLVAKTFWRVTHVDPGFRAEQVLTANVQLGDRYTPATAASVWAAVKARVIQAPGVRSAAWTQCAPMTGSCVRVSTTLSRDGKSTRRGAREAAVEPGYFETVGAQLVAGRFFTPEDREGAPGVAVVSERYSQRWFNGASSLGRTIHGEECTSTCRRYDMTIVGVVKEMVQEPTDGVPYPLVFESMPQQPREGQSATLLVRTSAEAAPIQALIRDVVKGLDAELPEPRFSSMALTLDERVAPRKYVLVLLVVFAALAGGLAIIGLYSVLAYLVAERTREIGIRIAVGADSRRVVGMVLGQGMLFTLAGVVLGSLLSSAAVRVLRGWMYEMSVYDVPTFVAVAAFLSLVALVASWLPARRASRVDPVSALRAE